MQNFLHHFHVLYLCEFKLGHYWTEATKRNIKSKHLLSKVCKLGFRLRKSDKGSVRTIHQQKFWSVWWKIKTSSGLEGNHFKAFKRDKPKKGLITKSPSKIAIWQISLIKFTSIKLICIFFYWIMFHEKWIFVSL